MATRDHKRLKLEIAFQRPSNRILFTLSDLRGESSLVRGTRTISLDRITQKAQEWQTTLAKFEKIFWTRYRTAISESLETVNKLGLENTDDKRNHILSDPVWKAKLEEASTSLMRDIGHYLLVFSEDVLYEFLPKENSQFWTVFNEILDKPTLDAFSETLDENSWLKIPLLQVRIEQTLLALPWWLARTKDHKSLWCCRYALAVSPSLRDTQPPDIHIEGDAGIRLLTITRPTFDLKPWFPITDEILESATPFLASNKLDWRMLDGVLGRHEQPKSENLFPPMSSPSDAFRGVTKNEVRNALLDGEVKPNLIFYQGHWDKGTDVGDRYGPPYFLVHDPINFNFEQASGDEAAISRIHLPVPLLEVIPPDNQNNILIMNACSSAAPPDQVNYIELYVDAHSVFVGANYPLLAEGSGTSESDLLRNLLKKQFLAHSLLESNWLRKEATDPTIDKSEIYKKAALCLFGDVRTNLFRKYNTDTEDNLSHLKLKLTNRWRSIFESLKLSDAKGMTFSLNETDDHSPTDQFALSEDGVELAIPPLAVSIDLCLSDPGNYLILGPAFSSKESVALVSKRFKTTEDMIQELSKRNKEGQEFQIGILAPRLTSTYMTRLAVQRILTDHFQSEAMTVLNDTVKFKPIHWQGKGNPDDMLAKDFLDEVDICLSLNKSVENLKMMGLNVIATDLESETAKLLKLPVEYLPRGALLARRNCMEDEETRIAIKEFCDNYNKGAETYEGGENKTGATIEDIPLLTLDRADGRYLSAIKRFAESSFFGNISFAWDNFAYKPMLSSESAQQMLSRIFKIDNKTSGMFAGPEGDSIASVLRLLKQAFSAELSSQSEWSPHDMTRLLETVLQRNEFSDIPNSIRDSLLRNWLQEIEQNPQGVREVRRGD